MGTGQRLDMKTFKKQVRLLGYSISYRTVSFLDLVGDSARIPTIKQDGQVINVGIMSLSFYEQHKALFDLLAANKNGVFKVE